MERVVIIGAGFGGLHAAQSLANEDYEVLMLDRQNYHLFQPLLYQVATASLEQEAIAYPVRSVTRRLGRSVKFHMTEVTDIDIDNKVLTTSTQRITFDKLIVAAGAVTNFFGNPSLERYAFELKDLDDAVRLRNRILTSFERAAIVDDPEERRTWLTFVIVGGGPTGVEFAGALSELVGHVIDDDYPEFKAPDEVRIILLEALDGVLNGYTDENRAYTRKRLEGMGVEVITEAMVIEAGEDFVALKDGTVIPTRTLLWAAGVKASPLAQKIDSEKTRGGRLVVTETLSLPEHPDVYAIGDIASFIQDGRPLPGVAQVAMQMGDYIGGAIAAKDRGEQPEPFRYQDRGSMAVIGRGAAVADVFGLRFKGFIAWIMWLGLHIFYLVGFRNRLLVMLNWAYDYLFFERKVRLILQATDSGNLPGTDGRDFEPEGVEYSDSVPA